jgi:5S rRNA maturation endonuclease (ribonuclease M5)
MESRGMTAEAIDFAKIMPGVAKYIWGDPNKRHSTKTELRWGTNGSRKVDLENGTWFDFESNEGGGVLDLLKREGLGREWLREHGFEKPNSNGADRSASRIVATYDYTDENGDLLFQVCRFEPKAFRQRRPDGRGGWDWSAKGVRPVIYNLPNVIEAIALERPIYVVEGEKDVATLAKHGIVATCNAGGASKSPDQPKWKSHHAAFLKDADVIIIPDNDPAGRAHADAVARSLTGKAARIRVLALPVVREKGDVSDWFSAGGTIEQFNELVAEAPNWQQIDKIMSGLGTWDAGDDEGRPIEPRQWLLGTIFCRKFLSMLLAGGGVGKTALRYAQYLSLATGHSLTGEHVFKRCRVLIISLEDSDEELRRRIRAVMIHHKIDWADVRGWLFLAAPNRTAGKLAITDEKGCVVPSDLAQAIETDVMNLKIDLVGIDPFIKSHGVEENSNDAIDAVMQILTDLLIKHNIAGDVPHHIRKGAADAGNADSGRGASAAKDAGRLVYTLTPMTPEEAKGFGLSEQERRSLVRMDSAKVNIAPPLTEAKWFRLVGVPLGNGTELYPHGDEVQAVEPWIPPDTWADLSKPILNDILTDIDAGLPDGERYSDAASAKSRAAWRVILKHAPDKTEKQARDIIKTWVKNGVLVAYEYDNQKTRKTELGLRVDDTKRPS